MRLICAGSTTWLRIVYLSKSVTCQHPRLHVIEASQHRKEAELLTEHLLSFNSLFVRLQNISFETTRSLYLCLRMRLLSLELISGCLHVA